MLLNTSPTIAELLQQQSRSVSDFTNPLNRAKTHHHHKGPYLNEEDSGNDVVSDANYDIIDNILMRSANDSDAYDDDDDSAYDDAYEDIESEDVEDGGQQHPQNVVWRSECTFQTKAELEKFMEKENCWSFRGSSDTIRGKKVLYRCNRVKRMSKIQCAAGVYVIEQNKYVPQEVNNANVANNSLEGVNDDGQRNENTISTTYSVYRKTAKHTHGNIENLAKPKVTAAVQKIIHEQYKNGRKPKKISYSILDNPDIPLDDKPSYKQVVNVVNAFKKADYGVVPITMRQLIEFVKKHKQLPNDIDSAFIIRFEKSARNVKEDKFCRFFISTRRLLSEAANAEVVHADATHKVTTEKSVLIAVGVTDPNKAFHFVGLTLANHEATDDYALTFNALKSGVRSVTGINMKPTVLVCDADTAIHNGYKKAFGDPDIIIMCYFHVLLNIQTKYKQSAEQSCI